MKRKFLFSAWLFVLAVLMAVGTVAPASAIGQTNGCQVVQCDNDDKPCPVLRIYLQPPDETPVVFKDVFVPSPLDKIYVGVGGVVSASMFGLPKDNNWAFAVMFDVNMVFRLGESNWGIMIDGQVGGGNAPGKAKVGIMPANLFAGVSWLHGWGRISALGGELTAKGTGNEASYSATVAQLRLDIFPSGEGKGFTLSFVGFGGPAWRNYTLSSVLGVQLGLGYTF